MKHIRANTSRPKSITSPFVSHFVTNSDEKPRNASQESTHYIRQTYQVDPPSGLQLSCPNSRSLESPHPRDSTLSFASPWFYSDMDYDSFGLQSNACAQPVGPLIGFGIKVDEFRSQPDDGFPTTPSSQLSREFGTMHMRCSHFDCLEPTYEETKPQPSLPMKRRRSCGKFPEDGSTGSSPYITHGYTVDTASRHGCDDDIQPLSNLSTPPMASVFVDINMNEREPSHYNLYVNPLDVAPMLSPRSPSPIQDMDSPLLHFSSPIPILPSLTPSPILDGFSHAQFQDVVNVLMSSSAEITESAVHPQLPQRPRRSPLNKLHHDYIPSSTPPSIKLEDSCNPPPSRLCLPVTSPATPSKKISLPTRSETPQPPIVAAPFPVPSVVTLDLGSPVFNAHSGIPIGDLEAKAVRYRERNHGKEDFDSKWLSLFTGKLNKNGELLEDYRCYVDGCSQKNKRRDHMLVHLGQHLDYRPFECPQCSKRFLRRNECKRHEAQHSGERPHICQLCSKSFTRLDLLWRHVRSTHETRDDADKENVGDLPRVAKRSRIQYYY